jgi:hypothetical protein
MTVTSHLMVNTPPKKKEKKLMSIVIDEVKLRRIEITTDYPSTVNCGRLVDHDMMKMMMIMMVMTMMMVITIMMVMIMAMTMSKSSSVCSTNLFRYRYNNMVLLGLLLCLTNI